MRTRILLATALTAVTATGAVAPAMAAKPKPPSNFTQNVTFSDPTPDPTGNLNDDEADHCSGRLPQEAPISVKVPGPGSLEVTLSGFQGDWSLQIKNSKGEIEAGVDVNPPDAESTAVFFKKAGTWLVLPCNMTGTPEAKVQIKYTYRK